MTTRATGGAVLVVYALTRHPLRETIRDHLYSFHRHSSRPCVYLNLAVRRVPRSLLRQRFDLIVFHTSFLMQRWAPDYFARLRAKAEPLKAIDAVRAVLPQDEFLHSDLLSAFIEDHAIDWVFSVAPESEWPKIYGAVDRERVRFARVLTGYLDDGAVRRVGRMGLEPDGRALDIAYRASAGRPWLGRHGMLKAQIAEAVERGAAVRGLRTDISTAAADTIAGTDWYRFLGSSRYTIGVEGGASILDRDGSLRACSDHYLAQRPLATFDDVEAACFPGSDGSLELFALSPRHLEACLTRTCQVLVEGSYNGILEPGRHYLELRRDFSNIDEVFDAIVRDDRRAELVEAAYQDVVASRRYSYAQFVAGIEHAALGDTPPPSRRRPRALTAAHARDRLSWAVVIMWVRFARPALTALRRALRRGTPA